MACASCTRELALPPGTRIETTDGLTAVIGDSGRVMPGSVQKASGRIAAEEGAAMGGILKRLAEHHNLGDGELR